MKLKLFLILLMSCASAMASDLILRCDVKNIRDKTASEVIIERPFGYYKNGVINELTTDQNLLPFNLIVHPGFELEKEEEEIKDRAEREKAEERRSGISKLAVSTKDGDIIFSSNMAFPVPKMMSTIVQVSNTAYRINCQIGKYQ